jgi:hypothetical protein
MSSTMRFLSYLATLMFAVLIAACGGGGGSPGATSGGGQTVPLSTTAPGNLTLPIGSSQDFTILGGASPYAAVSNNIAVMVAAVSGSNMTLGAVAPGVGEVTIRDAKGASVTVSVTVAVRQLSTTATPAITLAVGLSGAQTYGVTGGVAPYAVTSSDVNVASGAISGNSLTITGVTPGSATIQVRDSLGSVVAIAVTVSPTSSVALFTTAPPDVTVAVGESPVYSVGGGTAPYLATSSNTGVATAVLVGNSLMINGVAPGSASIVVRDKTGTSVTVAVTVPAPSSVFTTAPPSITVAIGSSPVYTVGGGTSPYTVTSSNTAVATASISGTSLTVNGLAAGSASILVRDSAGSVVTVAVTVPPVGTLPLFTTAPPSVTIAMGSSTSYTIGGGTSPYTATSSNTAVAIVSVTGESLTVQGVVAGNANIVVRDSAGQSVTVGVIVPPANNVPLFTSAPSSITVAMGASPSYTVGGGTSPYTATSSNTAVAVVSVTGTTLTVQGVVAGGASILIRDSAGATVNVAVTVPPANTVPLFTSAPSSITVAMGSSQSYTVGGGTNPYTATSSNTSVATVSVSGTTLTVQGVGAGNASILIRDSAGASVNVAVTVPPLNNLPLFTSAAPSVTIAVNSAAAYTVGGGTAPYTASSSNNSVATVSLFGANLAVSGVFAGNAAVVIRDSAGGTVNIAVTVSAAQMTVNPVTFNAFIGDTLYSTISGGTAPYSLVNGFPDAADADVGTLSGTVFTPNSSGNILRVRVKQAVGNDSITVRDSLGASASVSLTATAGTNQISLSPSALTISELNGPYPVTLTLYGGVGTVNLFSSDPSLLTVLSPVTGSATGTPVTVTKTANCVTSDASVTITAIDSLGSRAASVFTIKDSLSGPPCP